MAWWCTVLLLSKLLHQFTMKKTVWHFFYLFIVMKVVISSPPCSEGKCIKPLQGMGKNLYQLQLVSRNSEPSTVRSGFWVASTWSSYQYPRCLESISSQLVIYWLWITWQQTKWITSNKPRYWHKSYISKYKLNCLQTSLPSQVQVSVLTKRPYFQY